MGRAFAWVDQEKLHNWAGNIEYSTETLSSPASIRELQQFVRSRPKFKVLGTRHCFNDIADSKDAFVSLASLGDDVRFDTDSRTVSVNGAMKYGQLAPILDAKGLALHNLASLPHISIAGACITATHGSGERNGNLSTAVTALEIMTPGGEVRTLTRQQGGEFFGAVVNLGALGVITRVTLETQPTYNVRQYVYQNLPLSQLVEHFDEIEKAAYSVSFFTDWQNKRINELWLKCRVGSGPAFPAPQEFFDAKIATRNLHPIEALSAENCTEQMGVPGPWYDRLPHFKMGFTPSAGKELQAEYFIPRQHAVEAILAVERLRDQITPHLFISEIRSIAADELWMSPCYKPPCVTSHFTLKPEWNAVRELLPIIERELEPFNARPHWGKLFTVSRARLHKIYDRMPEFVRLCQTYDPKRKLQNRFLERNIFGAV
ncbi:MAG: FAD-binding protein [Acidobacteriaceae bacterium]